MIKFASRRNLIYPLQLLIWHTASDIYISLIGYFFNFTDSFTLIFLMSLGELISGLIFYLYNKKLLSNHKEGKDSIFYKLGISKRKKGIVRDGKIKITFLIFHASFLNFLQFLLFLLNDYYNFVSKSLRQRLRGSFTIYLALFYYYLLKLPIFKHQIFSLIFIGACILIILITEFIFQEVNILFSYGKFYLMIFLAIFTLFIVSIGEIIEKYLFEYNQLSPFFVLMIEGIFGLVFAYLYGLYTKSNSF